MTKATNHWTVHLQGWKSITANSERTFLFPLLPFFSLSSLHHPFPHFFVSVLKLHIKPGRALPQVKTSLFSLTCDLWRTRLCAYLPPCACLYAFLMFLNLSPPTANWQVCLVCQSSGCKTHSTDCVIAADIFLMSAICAHPASNQILPHMRVCVCVHLRTYVLVFPSVYYVIVSNIFPLTCSSLTGYPGAYPATAPTYTPNLYQTGSPGYPPGELLHTDPVSFLSLFLCCCFYLACRVSGK